jgi:hypothetical protein
MTVSHERCVGLIEREFERGGLSPDESARMREHLRDCETCERVYTRYAQAEAALHPRPADASPAQIDRVARRLFGDAPPRRRAPRAWVGLGAAVLAGVVAIVVTAGPSTSGDLQSRQGVAEDVDPSVGLRALRLRSTPEGVAVDDVGGGGAVEAGDRIALTYSDFVGHDRLEVVRVGPDGARVFVAAVEAPTTGRDDVRIAVVTVDGAWAPGRHRFEARFEGGDGPRVRVVEVEVSGP